MNNESKNNASRGGSIGIGFVGLLQITFIVLKLCGVIDWSWLWVLAPAWISVAATVAGVVIVLIVAAIANRYVKRSSEL